MFKEKQDSEKVVPNSVRTIRIPKFPKEILIRSLIRGKCIKRVDFIHANGPCGGIQALSFQFICSIVLSVNTVTDKTFVYVADISISRGDES
jgi:hypothetical protein